MKPWRRWAAAALVTAGAGSAWAGWAPTGDFPARLQALRDSGRIDGATAALYGLYAVRAPERLPAELRVETGGPGARREALPAEAAPWIVKCGTPMVRALRARAAGLPPAAAAEAADLLAPPPGSPAHRSPRTAGKEVSRFLPKSSETANFSVQWGCDLTNEDGTDALDSGCNPLQDSAPANGVPDVVDRWAGYFEESYSQEEAILAASALGPQPFGGTAVETHLVPVLIGNSEPTTGVENIGGTTYALTYEDTPIPYIVVNNDLRFVPDNSDPDGKIPGAMKITAAHEFFHVLHFEYEPAVWEPTADDWWLEASSTWIEDEVYDAVDDYLQFLEPRPAARSWADLVEAGLPVATNDPDYVTRAYGAVIFAKYLSEHVGGGASMGDVWDVIRGPPGARVLDALEQYAASRGFGGGLKELFLGFAAANATMDYEEGAAYDGVPVRSTTLTRTGVTTNLPFYLGATYAEQLGLTGDRTVLLSGAPAVPWGLSVVVSRGGYALVLGAVGPTGVAQVPLSSLRSGDRVFAAVSFLEPTSTSGGGTGTDGGGGGGGCFVEELGALRAAARSLSLATPVSYSTAVIDNANPDREAPSQPGALAAAPVAGGADLGWLPASDNRLVIAGYVVRWRKQGTLFRSRTVPGPVLSVELRGLEPATTYDAEVFAYDAQGNEGAPASTGFTTL